MDRSNSKKPCGGKDDEAEAGRPKEEAFISSDDDTGMIEHQAVSSAASDVAVEDEKNAIQPIAVNAKEGLHVLRAILVFLLLLAGGLIGGLVYLRMRRVQELAFQRQFESYVLMLDDALQVRFADKGKAAAAAAAVFIYPPGGQKFFREFNAFALAVVSVSGIRKMGLAAVITENDDRAAYERFVAQRGPLETSDARTLALLTPAARKVMTVSYQAGIQDFGTGAILNNAFVQPFSTPPPRDTPPPDTKPTSSNAISSTAASPVVDHVGRSGQQHPPLMTGPPAFSRGVPPSSPPPPAPPRDVAAGAAPSTTAGPERRSKEPPLASATVPLRYWVVAQQQAPLANSWSGFLMDLRGTNTERRAAQDYAMTMKEIVDINNNITNRGSAQTFAPMLWQDPKNASAPAVVTGFCHVVFSFDTFFKGVLPSYVERIDLVLSTPLTAFTLRLALGTVQNVGWGDLHRGTRDGYTRTLRLNFGGMRYTLQVFPSDELYESFFTSRPMHFVLGIVGSLVTCFAVFTAYDLLTRRRLEELMGSSAELRAQDALAKKRQTFLSMVSHEVRTPAAAILGAASLLESRGDLPPEERGMLPIVTEGANQILNLVQDALAAGSSSMEFHLTERVVDPWAEVVERAWSTAQLQSRLAEKIATLQMELRQLCPLPRAVQMDAVRARQVILNVLVNSTKFTPEGGSIVMTVDIVEGEADSQRGKSEAFSPSSLRLLRVRVADTGIGLRPEGIARLFQPFSQAEARPRLLAAAARAIALAMGGDLMVHSDGPGKGAEFTITMRLVPAPSLEVQAAHERRRTLELQEAEEELAADIVERTRTGSSSSLSSMSSDGGGGGGEGGGGGTAAEENVVVKWWKAPRALSRAAAA